MGIFDGLISEYPLGERIRYFRKELDMTQTELAKKCKLSQSLIAQLEKSQLMCSIQNLKTICKVLNIELASLFAEDDIFVFNYKKLKTIKDFNELSPSQKRSLSLLMKWSKNLKGVR